MAAGEQPEAPEGGEPPAKPEQPAAKPAPQPKSEASLPGGAAPQRPARAERAADAKAPTREPPPPGGVADLLTEALPDVSFEAYQGMSHVIVEIDRGDIPRVMRAAKDDPRLDLKYLRCLSGVDQMEEGLEVVYHLMSLEKGHEVTIKTGVPTDDPRVPSVVSVWQAAEWHERETRDMFGIVFEGHPHLVPLLLPEDMLEHFPLRKDVPLQEIEEWQGEFLEVGAGAPGPDGGGEEETEE